MQVFIKINEQTSVFNLDNEKTKYHTIMKMIEDKLQYNQNFFWIKASGKILTENCEIKECMSMELMWRNVPFQNLYLDGNNKIKIPNQVLLESNVMLSLLDPMNEKSTDELFDDNEIKLNFDSNGILNTDRVYHWINLSYKLNRFLNQKNLNNNELKIPRPLNNRPFSNYVGENVFNYLDNLSLNELKEIATMSDFLDIGYLLEMICAFIADKFIKNKNIEEIKNLDLI